MCEYFICHQSNFKGYSSRCLPISEAIGCSQIRHLQDFIHVLCSNRLPLVYIYGCTAELTLLRVITLHGCSGIHLFLQLCLFCSAVLAAGKDIAQKNSLLRLLMKKDITLSTACSMPHKHNKNNLFTVYFLAILTCSQLKTSGHSLPCFDDLFCQCILRASLSSCFPSARRYCPQLQIHTPGKYDSIHIQARKVVIGKVCYVLL